MISVSILKMKQMSTQMVQVRNNRRMAARMLVRMRETIESFHVVGLPLCTSNREAARTIPLHWQAAAGAGLLDHDESGAGTYAVYTDYESPGDDVAGIYTLVIGRRVEPGGPVAPDLVTVRIPASSREVIPLVSAQPQDVGRAWAGVWARDDLSRDYLADYEYYAPDGSNHLSIGIRSDT